MKKVFCCLFGVVLFLFLYSCGGNNNSDVTTGVADETTNGDGAAIENLAREVGLYFDEQLELVGEDAARQNLLSQLKDNPLVAEYALSEDNYSVWYKDKQGIIYVVVTDSFDDISMDPGTSKKNNSSFGSHRFKSSSSALSGLVAGTNDLIMFTDLVPFFWQQVAACVREVSEDYNLCSDPKTFPFIDYSGVRDLSKYYADPAVLTISYALDFLNENASVDAMKGLLMTSAGPQHLVIHSHGGIARDGLLGPAIHYILLGDSFSSDVAEEYMDDLLAGRLMISYYKSQIYLAFTPSFVRYYGSKADLTKRELHVAVQSCHAFHDSMRSAFLSVGAKSYSSFTGYVSHDFSYKAVIDFFSLLATGYTPDDAWAQMPNHEDPHYSGTFFKVESASPVERYFRRMYFVFDDEAYVTPPAKMLKVISLSTDGPILMSPVMFDVDDVPVSAQVGIITISWPTNESGTFEILPEGPTANIEFYDQKTGIKWYASQECLKDNPACACNGVINVEYFNTSNQTYIEGKITAELVNASDESNTKHFEANFYSEL